MSLIETIVSTLRSKRKPQGTVHVVDHSPLNWLYITYNTVEELIRTDPQGHIVPAAMSSYKWLDDVTLEIKVREGEVFQDGEVMNSASVKRSFDEMMKWRSPHPPGTQFNNDPRTRLEVIDDETVRLIFPEPDVTALLAGGSSTSIVGAGDFTPQTNSFRMFYLFTSLVGTSIISLTLTYLLQVYTALQRRNALGLKLHLFAAETGDDAELLAGLGPQGKFDGGYNNLSEMAAEMSNVKESHHFYTVLSFFRFRNSYYSVSQSTLLALDTVTLIKSALDDIKYAWLKESAAVTQLWRASMLLLTTLSDTFFPRGAPDSQDTPDEEMRKRWCKRYFAGLRRLKQAGIETIADEKAGAETYVSLRAEWDHRITMLAPTLAYCMEEIDPAGSRPESADERTKFRTRLSSVG